jgi:hypothetical protein
MKIQNAFKTSFFLLTFIFMASISKPQTANNFKLISSAFKEDFLKKPKILP